MSAAFSAHVQQEELESQAFCIHRAITGGQDVFIAWAIERHEVPVDSQTTAELEAIYGRDYLTASGMLTSYELIIEVATVLAGDLEPGMILTIPRDRCPLIQPGDSDLIFLHFDDGRLRYPHSPAEELYMVVSREVLDWYRSLTPEQVKDLEARHLAE